MSAWSDTLARLGAGLRDQTMPKAEWRRALEDTRAGILARAGKRSRTRGGPWRRDVERLVKAQEDAWASSQLSPEREAEVRKILSSGQPPDWTTAHREEAVAVGLRVAGMPPVLLERGLEVLRMLDLPLEEEVDRHLSENANLEQSVMDLKLQIESVVELQRRLLAAAEAAAVRNGPARWEHATPSEKRACALRVAKGQLTRHERARRMAREYEEGESLEGAVYAWLDRQERSRDPEARRFVRELTAPPTRRPSAAGSMAEPTAGASSPARRSKAS
jgi:hypothetical protein